MDDRRKHQRFKLDGACAIKHDKKVGTILDISLGGLSCMCLDQGECSQGLSTRIKIFCKKHNVCAEDIKMEVIGTEKVLGQFMDDIGMRKCRTQFLQVDASQLVKLKNIIVKVSLPSSSNLLKVA